MSNDLAIFEKNTEIVPSYVEGNTGLGNEGVTTDDLTVPKLNLLQGISPQVGLTPECIPGKLHNDITNEVYDEVYVVNLAFRKNFPIFKKRKLGGGIEGSYDTLEEAKYAMDELNNPVDYDIVETHKHACLIVDPETGECKQPVLLYMSNTKVTFSKKWNTDIQLKGGDAPRFASVWKLSPIKQTNSAGTFYNLRAEYVGWLPDEAFEDAKEMYTHIKNEI